MSNEAKCIVEKYTLSLTNLGWNKSDYFLKPDFDPNSEIELELKDKMYFFKITHNFNGDMSRSQHGYVVNYKLMLEFVFCFALPSVANGNRHERYIEIMTEDVILIVDEFRKIDTGFVEKTLNVTSFSGENTDGFIFVPITVQVDYEHTITI